MTTNLYLLGMVEVRLTSSEVSAEAVLVDYRMVK
jgi:hypothetical protein